MIQRVQQRLGSHQANPGRGKLKRQRQPLECQTQAGNRGRVPAIQGEGGVERACPLDKEANRRNLAETSEISFVSIG